MSTKLSIIGSLHCPALMVSYKIKKKCYILRGCLVGARKMMIFFLLLKENICFIFY